MGVNKVEYGGETLIDLTSDTVSADTLAEGETAHNAAGEEITGTMKGLPDYSTDNNGQVLTIVDGSPDWETPSYTSDEDILGVWKFIDEPDVDSLSSTGVDIAFISNDTNFVAMWSGTVGPDYFGIKSLNYKDEYSSGYRTVYTNNPSGNYGITHGWSDEAYKIITITEAPTDDTLIAWLKANARKVSLNDISSIDSTVADATGLIGYDSCICWKDEVAFYGSSATLHKTQMYHQVPISAGDNIVFSKEDNTFKISASSGDEIVTTTGTATAYEATVSNITEIKAGVSFTMIPHVSNTQKDPTLNVNGLGAITMKRYGSKGDIKWSAFGASALFVNVPIRVMYDGYFWVVNLHKPYANDLEGTVPVENGGIPSALSEEDGKVLTVSGGEPVWADSKTLDKVSQVDTWAGDVTGLDYDGSCIYWDDEVAFYDENSNELSRAEISHFVPISAGNGVSFAVENDSVKISASGGGGGGSLEMPQIRFTGAISTASLEGAPYQLSVGYGFGLTVAIIGGGALQVGDRVQVCKVKTKWKKKKSNGAIRVKQCLRRFTEIEITEDNVEHRCFTVPIILGVDDCGYEFSHNGRKDTRKIFPMFMRIKRIMGYNDYGEEYQAIFSNVVQFWVSYNEVAGIHPVSIF